MVKSQYKNYVTTTLLIFQKQLRRDVLTNKCSVKENNSDEVF